MKQGFTTVELLVTVFVAVMMVVSGYQLYNAITNRNGRMRALSEASGIAYNRLRDFSDHATADTATMCSASQTSGVSITTYPASTLPGGATSIVYRCKVDSSLSVIRVTSIVRYGTETPKREVVHAIFVAP